MSLEYRQALVNSREGLDRYKESLSKLDPSLYGMQGTVADVLIYPVKALGGISVKYPMVGRDGLSTFGGFKDRMAMIVDLSPGRCKDGDFDSVRLSQRTFPQLENIQAKASEFGKINFSGPNSEVLRVSASDLGPKEGKTVVTRMFDDGELTAGVLENGPLTEWLRSFLSNNPGRRGGFDVNKLGVVVETSDFERRVEELHRRGVNSTIHYSDGGQLLVTSKATLDWLNQGMRDDLGEGAREIKMGAFRPNIVLGGLPANVEDLIDEALIGEVRLQFGKMCVRCAVPNIDPKTATVTGEPGKWLTKNRPRRPAAPKPTFGVIAEFVVDEDSCIMRDQSFKITGEKTGL